MRLLLPLLTFIITNPIIADLVPSPSTPREIEVDFGQSIELQSTLTNTASEPADGAIVFEGKQDLSWRPVPSASSYRLFLGTEEEAVTNADITSPDYQGETDRNNFPGGVDDLFPGQTYFWRIDYEGPDGWVAGSTIQFTIAPLLISPTRVEINLPEGAPVTDQILTLSAPNPIEWSASTSPGLSLSEINGRTDTTVTLQFETKELPTGSHQKTIFFRVGTETYAFPVTLNVFENQPVRIKPSPSGDRILALSSQTASLGPSFLLEIDATSGRIMRYLDAGENPSDFSFSDESGKIHLLAEGGSPSFVVDYSEWAYLDPLTLPADGRNIEALDNDRLMIGSSDGRNRFSLALVNSQTSEVLFENVAFGLDGPAPLPMTVSPGDAALFILDLRENLSSYEISDDGLVQVASNPDQEFSSDGSRLVFDANGDSLFFKNYRFNRQMEPELRFPDAFRVLAVDAEGLIAIGEEEVRYARSGELIAHLDYPSRFAALSANQQFMVRFNPESGFFDSTPVDSILSLPGPVPQPKEEVVGTLETISIPPVEGATSYEIFLGPGAGELFRIRSQETANFNVATILPAHGRVFWRIDALIGDSRIAGRESQFSILPEAKTISLDQDPTSLRVTDGFLTASHGDSLRDGKAWIAPVHSEFPETLPAAVLIPGAEFSELSSAKENGYAGGRLFTNSGNTIEGYEPSDLGDYRRTLSLPVGDSPGSGQLVGFETSGDLLFARLMRLDLPARPVTIQVYRTDPEMVPEQTISKPTEDATIDGFGDEIAVAGNLLVVANSNQRLASNVHLWVYRRDGTASSPWRLSQTITSTRSFRRQVKVATDGRRIALLHGDPDTSDRRITVFQEGFGGRFAAQWTSVSTEIFDQSLLPVEFADLKIDQGFIAMSDPWNSSGPAGQRGTVLVLERIGANWRVLPPISATRSGGFGSSLELSDGTLFATGGDSQIYRYDLRPQNNRSPLFASRPPVQVVAGRPYDAVIEIEDDSESFTVEAIQKPAWMNLESENGEYRLTGTSPQSPTDPTPVRLRVTDEGGLATYLTFTLEQIQSQNPPEIVYEGGDAILGVGQEFRIKPETNGVGPFSWQWFFNGNPIEGATGSDFTLNQITQEDAGIYYVIAANTAGSVTGATVELTVNPANRFAGDWKTFGNSSRHLGYHPAALGTHFFKEAWSRQIYLDTNLNRPAIAEGKAFVSPTRARPEAFAAALSLESGSIEWERNFAEADSLNPPSYHEGRLYLQRGNHGSDSQLWALDAQDGTSVWNAPFTGRGDTFEAPTVSDDAIFTSGGARGGFYGFDQSGTEIFFQGSAEYDRWTPSVANDRLYTWIYPKFTEHDALSGNEIWSVTVEGNWRNTLARTVSAVTGNEALVASTSHLYCIDLETRTIRWERTPAEVEPGKNPPLPSGSPAVFEDQVYLIAGDALRSYDLQTGHLRETYQANEEIISQQPLLTNDHLFFSTGSETQVINLESGGLVQTLPVGGLLSYSNGYLLITSGGTLHAYFANDIPDIETISLPEVTEDEPYSQQLVVNHDDAGEDLVFTLRNAPEFLTLSPTGELTGLFESDAETTTHLIEVEVTDGVTPPVAREFTLTLVNVNDPPQLTPREVDLLEDDPTFSIPLAQLVSDEETPLDSLVISLSGNPDPSAGPIAGFEINDENLTITPLPDRFGDFDITLTVRDPGGAETIGVIPVRVQAVPDPPRMLVALADLTTTEAGDDLNVDLAQAFTDPDPGDSLTFALTGNSNPAIFSNLTTNEGLLRFQFAPYQSGSSEVTVTATDPGGLTLSQTFSVTLPDLPAPQIDSEGSITLNRRTGLYEHKITVTNSAARAIGGFDLNVTGLVDGYVLRGWPDQTIRHPDPIAIGQSVTLTLEYHSPTSRALPTPEFETIPRLPVEFPVVVPTDRDPDRLVVMPDRSILLEFASISNVRYQIQYSYDMETWFTSPQIVTASANRTLWVDQGPPKTNCHPADCKTRIYRILKLTDESSNSSFSKQTISLAP